MSDLSFPGDNGEYLITREQLNQMCWQDDLLLEALIEDRLRMSPGLQISRSDDFVTGGILVRWRTRPVPTRESASDG